VALRDVPRCSAPVGLPARGRADGGYWPQWTSSPLVAISSWVRVETRRPAGDRRGLFHGVEVGALMSRRLRWQAVLAASCGRSPHAVEAANMRRRTRPRRPRAGSRRGFRHEHRLEDTVDRDAGRELLESLLLDVLPRLVGIALDVRDRDLDGGGAGWAGLRISAPSLCPAGAALRAGASLVASGRGRESASSAAAAVHRRGARVPYGWAAHRAPASPPRGGICLGALGVGAVERIGRP